MQQGAANPFQWRTVLGLVVFGFLAFLAMLYFIGAGDTGSRGNDARAHAASNGLNGFSGLAKLLELEGMNVEVSRSPGGLDTYGLLVLTPPPYLDADDFEDILRKREDRGPTIVILPKWFATKFPDSLPDEIEEQIDVDIKEGWVRLIGASEPTWPEELTEPYAFKLEEPMKGEIEVEGSQTNEGENPSANNPPTTGSSPARLSRLRWSGMGRSGQLPDPRALVAIPTYEQDILVREQDGGALIFEVVGEEGSDYYDNAHMLIFVAEPDLMNNYGLSDSERAALAVDLIRYASYDDDMTVTFDLTLNGFGGSANLLTLAFRPPFLAATLCLILAMLVIGWRAFRRFGPPIAEAPAIAFGKQRLVHNGAGLILRAKRYRLLAEPYLAIVTRRIQSRLGVAQGDPEVIDEAVARRLPDETPFSQRAAALRAANRPSEILRAAAALKELEGKLVR